MAKLHFPEAGSENFEDWMLVSSDGWDALHLAIGMDDEVMAIVALKGGV